MFLKIFKNTKLKISVGVFLLLMTQTVPQVTAVLSGLQKNFVWHLTELVKIQNMAMRPQHDIFTICKKWWFPA